MQDHFNAYVPQHTVNPTFRFSVPYARMTTSIGGCVIAQFFVDCICARTAGKTSNLLATMQVLSKQSCMQRAFDVHSMLQPPHHMMGGQVEA